jgi:hypothetical protein
MNIKPILFSTPMVQAILEGRKTMTRRTKGFEKLGEHSNVKLIPKAIGNEKDWGKWYFETDEGETVVFNCPYGQVGDVLWVRETFIKNNGELPTDLGYIYKADLGLEEIKYSKELKVKWKPSLFMPKEACRLFLKITNVKAERLQDISEKDAKAEGVESCIADREHFGVRAAGMRLYRDYDRKNNSLKDYPCNGFEFAKTSFETLWQSINGEQSWNDNPYVWVVEFEQCEKPLNFLKQ